MGNFIIVGSNGIHFEDCPKFILNYCMVHTEKPPIVKRLSAQKPTDIFVLP
jgi:hypothetical protein